ncbi:MAG: hypothetical protein HWD85_01855 [Flavobacteriaceae bacterium]|nr:hypothetical protein [Flavobacteriaceae bacterium]
MKKALLLLGLMSFVSTYSNDYYPLSTKKTSHVNTYTDAVTFIEKGILFHVFLNGDFEFERPRRTAVYFDYNGYRYQRNGLRIYRDYKGRIKRVGNNYIRYDSRGNVRKIGNIRLYYRKGLLRKVGDLRITYNYWGEPYFYGSVHNDYYDETDIHFSLNFGPVYRYNDRFFYDRFFKDNYRKYREDRHYYYYKAKPNAKIGKRGKIIKRRKSVDTKRNNTNVHRRRATDTNRRTYRQHSGSDKKEQKVDRRTKIKRKKEATTRTSKRRGNERRN